MKRVISPKYALLCVAILGVAGLAFFFLRDTASLPKGVETGEVKRELVEEVVNETGFVQGARSVGLSFQTSGQIREVIAEEGDKVAEGALLAVLDDARAKSELAVAEARLRAEEIRLSEMIAGADTASKSVYETAVTTAETALENARINLEKVTAQNDTLVTNALQSLRSSSLQAVLTSERREDTNYSYTAPTITGTYTGTEGVYELELYNSGASSGSSFTYKGLESGTGEVSTIGPVPLGSQGLYIQFPSNFASRTTWEVRIPNTKSSTYLTNLNTYNATLRARDAAVSAAENAVRTAEAALAQARAQLAQVSGTAREERIAAQQALVEQMAAMLEQARIAQKNTTITAPFSGVVTDVVAKAGQVITAGVPALTLVSESGFEVLVNMSEIDIAEVGLGDKVTITLDAYDGVTFEGEVTEIAPRVSVISGVRVVPVTVSMTTKDERIKEGFTAQVDIHTASKENVIAIPNRAVYEDDAGKFVLVVSDVGAVERRVVRTGLRGTNGLTELTEGLREGERVVTFANADTLPLLMKK